MNIFNVRPNAKLLWKRIPNEIKQSNSEIQAVWNVGIKLFKRELSDIYALVDSVEWPLHLNNIMNCIKGLYFISSSSSSYYLIFKL